MEWISGGSVERSASSAGSWILFKLLTLANVVLEQEMTTGMHNTAYRFSFSRRPLLSQWTECSSWAGTSSGLLIVLVPFCLEESCVPYPSFPGELDSKNFGSNYHCNHYVQRSSQIEQIGLSISWGACTLRQEKFKVTCPKVKKARGWRWAPVSDPVRVSLRSVSPAGTAGLAGTALFLSPHLKERM